MYHFIRKNWDKNKHILLFVFILFSVLLVAVVNKSDKRILKKSQIDINSYDLDDLKKFKEFVYNKINSPFTNINYTIQKNDTIQKILQKYKIKNSEIQTVINDKYNWN